MRLTPQRSESMSAITGSEADHGAETGAPAARGRAAPAIDIPVEWQHLWFAVVQRPWTALAIVPAHPGIGASSSAQRLLAAGRAFSTTPIDFIDASGADPQHTREVIARLEEHTRHGHRCIVAVGSPLAQPAAIAVSRAAGAALLIVPLEVAQGKVARRTVDCIGREHFIGAVAARAR